MPLTSEEPKFLNQEKFLQGHDEGVFIAILTLPPSSRFGYFDTTYYHPPSESELWKVKVEEKQQDGGGR